MSYCAAIHGVVNPAIRPGLDALDWWLADNHYSQHARERIVAYAAAEGTPTGSPYLEAEDEAEASEAFVGALPAVPFDSAEWGPDEDLDGLDLPPMCGGGPDPDDELWWAQQARLADERAEAMESCRRLDALAELRAAEERAEARYGWE